MLLLDPKEVPSIFEGHLVIYLHPLADPEGGPRGICPPPPINNFFFEACVGTDINARVLS